MTSPSPSPPDLSSLMGRLAIQTKPIHTQGSTASDWTRRDVINQLEQWRQTATPQQRDQAADDLVRDHLAQFVDFAKSKAGHNPPNPMLVVLWALELCQSEGKKIPRALMHDALNTLHKLATWEPTEAEPPEAQEDMLTHMLSVWANDVQALPAAQRRKGIIPSELLLSFAPPAGIPIHQSRLAPIIERLASLIPCLTTRDNRTHDLFAYRRNMDVSWLWLSWRAQAPARDLLWSDAPTRKIAADLHVQNLARWLDNSAHGEPLSATALAKWIEETPQHQPEVAPLLSAALNSRVRRIGGRYNKDMVDMDAWLGTLAAARAQSSVWPDWVSELVPHADQIGLLTEELPKGRAAMRADLWWFVLPEAHRLDYAKDLVRGVQGVLLNVPLVPLGQTDNTNTYEVAVWATHQPEFAPLWATTAPRNFRLPGIAADPQKAQERHGKLIHAKTTALLSMASPRVRSTWNVLSGLHGYPKPWPELAAPTLNTERHGQIHNQMLPFGEAFARWKSASQDVNLTHATRRVANKKTVAPTRKM